MDDEPLKFTDRPKRTLPPIEDRMSDRLSGLGRGSEAHDLARAIATLHTSHKDCVRAHEFPEGCPLFKAWEERRPR